MGDLLIWRCRYSFSGTERNGVTEPKWRHSIPSEKRQLPENKYHARRERERERERERKGSYEWVHHSRIGVGSADDRCSEETIPNLFSPAKPGNCRTVLFINHPEVVL